MWIKPPPEHLMAVEKIPQLVHHLLLWPGSRVPFYQAASSAAEPRDYPPWLASFLATVSVVKQPQQLGFGQHMRLVLLFYLRNYCDFTHNDVTTHNPYRSRHTVLSVCGRYHYPVHAIYSVFWAIFDCPGSKHSSWICILIRCNRWRHVVI